MKSSYLRNFNPIGLDIQANRVSITEICGKKHPKKILLNISQQIEALYQENKIRDWNKLYEVLHALAVQYNLKNRAVALQIPANLTYMQYLELPLGMSEDDILDEIKQRLERNWSNTQEDFAIDFIVEKKTLNEMEVFFVAAQRDYIHKYIECVNRAGFIVKIITIDALVCLHLARIFKHEFVSDSVDKNFNELKVTLALDGVNSLAARIQEVYPNLRGESLLSLGLSLIDTKTSVINLYPWRQYRYRQQQKSLYKLLLGSSLLFMSVILMAHHFIQNQLKIYANKMMMLRDEFNDFKTVDRDKLIKNDARNLLQSIQNKRIHVLSMLSQLEKLGSNFCITGIHFSDDQWTINGRAYDPIVVFNKIRAFSSLKFDTDIVAQQQNFLNLQLRFFNSAK